jgi:hypothetical protein
LEKNPAIEMIEMAFIRSILTKIVKKMKALGKLNINSEKIIKNEELANLKGGQIKEPGCMCLEQDGTPLGHLAGPTSQITCTQQCNETWDPPYFGAYGKWG